METEINVFSIIEDIIIRQTAIEACDGETVNYNVMYDIADLPFSVELSKDKSHGDVATNIAMVLTSKIRNELSRNISDFGNLDNNTRINTIEIAKKLAKKLSESSTYVISAEVAGPGFINLSMSNEFWHEFLEKSNIIGMEYGRSELGHGEKINIEFVSANPTGPMHIGHARGAIYGDTLARLLEIVGYNIEREYVINDAGRQVQVLAMSLWIRYQQACGADIVIPNECYPGSYLCDIAHKLKDLKGESLLGSKYEDIATFLKEFAMDEIMAMIKEDLAGLDVAFDLFSSEQKDVIDKGKVEEAIEYLKSKDLIYFGLLEQPKGKASDDWEPREQWLFRSTAFGDESDRAIIKADGSYTYMTPDMAYHKTKIDRGATKLITLLGADHGGYVKRICSSVKAISDNKAEMKILIMQLVNLLDDGVPVKMSKRAGKFLTVKDVLNELGKDILRFIMLMRKGDTVLDLDFTKAKEQSKENPAFSVQYAHTRAASILRKALADGIIADGEMEIKDSGSVNQTIGIMDGPQAKSKGRHNLIHYGYQPQNEIRYEFLTSESDINLIKQMAMLPKTIEAAANNYEPHRIAYYLQDLAASLHGAWNMGVNNDDLRFIIMENIELSRARVALVYGVAKTIGICLGIMGIKPMLEM